jgi:prepilin-type N-terminal cleavage/methylation domain-containing protein
MTSPTSGHTDLRPRRSGSRAPRAFTLVELLVVVGIIVVLISILAPSLNRAWKSALRTSLANDLQAVGAALEAYRQDFGDYPRVTKDLALTDPPPDPKRPNPMTGAQVLCFALMGPAPAVDPNAPPAGQRPIQDGQDGPGFRGKTGGKIYPPYLSLDRFKIGDPSDIFGKTITTQSSAGAVGNELLFCIVDKWNNPILYFPRSPARPNVSVKPAAGQAAPYVDSKIVNTTIPSSEVCRYDADDNLIWFTGGSPGASGGYGGPRDSTPPPLSSANNAKLALKRIRYMLGDRHNTDTPPTGPPYTPDGVIESYETAVDLPFLLWSAGPDERFGPFAITFANSNVNDSDVNLFNDCDDVTNFPRK